MPLYRGFFIIEGLISETLTDIVLTKALGSTNYILKQYRFMRQRLQQRIESKQLKAMSEHIWINQLIKKRALS